MFNVYREHTQTCDHMGCCQDSGFSVESEKRNGAFISVCYEHANEYGSRRWSSNYNSVRYTNEKPSFTVLVNVTPRPEFNEKEIVIDVTVL